MQNRRWVARAWWVGFAVCVAAWGVVGCSNDSKNLAQTLAGTGPSPAGTTAIGAAGVPAAGVAGTALGAAGTPTSTGSSGIGGVAAGSGGASGTAAGSSASGAAGAAAGSGVNGASGAAAGSSGDSSAAGAMMMMSMGPPAGCPTMPLAAGDHEFTIDSKNGQSYKYILSLPKSVDPNLKSPLLIHWHALSSDPEEARSLTSVDAKAEAAKVIAVFPRSPDKSWDVGSCCTSTVGGVSRDESVFVRELVADVISKACVDEHRIYTNGFSNGGMISQMIACKASDLFAAAAPMGSTLTIPESDCKPTRPIPIFMVNGTEDPLVGYTAPGFAGGISVTDDYQFWATQNKCTGTPEMFMMMGKATCKRWTQCAAGVEVAYCSVEGMGHCVPGMKKESDSNCLTKGGIPLGAPSDDIDAIQMDLDFLLRFTLP
jgi:polyhydroxybutyrate depolymerase